MTPLQIRLNRSLLAYILCGLVAGLSYCCKKADEPTVPVPVGSYKQPPTIAIRSTTSALASATLTTTSSTAGETLTVGFVWSNTNSTPTIADAKTIRKVVNPTLSYVYSDSLTGLETNGTYIIRAYVTSATGTIYSAPATFVVKLSVVDAFAQTLTGLLQNRDIGYGFVLFENNEFKVSGSGGLKSRIVDPSGVQPYTIDTKMHVASMSKTIAAMAFTQLMAQKGIRTTDRISRYLPPSWPKGDNIGAITFLELFNHRSGSIGLTNACVNGSYDENIYTGLKQLIAKGVKTENRGQYCYQNANIGLMRVLIPAITGYSFTGNDIIDDQQTQQLYRTYIQQNVFEKVGLQNIVPTYPSGNPTYSYNYPYTPGLAGWNPGDFSATLGAYGWYLTPLEAGKLYATVLSSTDQSVIPTAYKDTLLLKNLGCFRIASTLGDVAYHDGWWYKTPYVGLRTIWMKFPDNLTAVLFVNAVSSKTGLFPSDDGVDIVPFVFRAYSTARKLSGGRQGPILFQAEHPEPH